MEKQIQSLLENCILEEWAGLETISNIFALFHLTYYEKYLIQNFNCLTLLPG